MVKVSRAVNFNAEARIRLNSGMGFMVFSTMGCADRRRCHFKVP
jgi:hypothetical protein